MIRVVIASVLALAAVAALLVGVEALAVLVLVIAVVALLDLSLLLGRGGARPVLPVALVPGLVLPALVAFDIDADQTGGWERIPDVFAIAVMLGFLLVLLFGRRGGATAGLGATFIVGLLVGLGSASVLLLRALPDGFRWVLALLVLVIAADVAGPLARLMRSNDRRRSDDAYGYDEFALVAGAEEEPSDVGLASAVIAVLLAAALVYATLAPPLGAATTALLALIALIAVLGGDHLLGALAGEAGIDADAAHAPRLGQGIVFGLVDSLLLASPAAYVLARAVAI